MVQAREKQLSESENETKLEQVQLRFPSDDLFLNHSLNIMEVRVWVGENVCEYVWGGGKGVHVCCTVLYSSVSHYGNYIA